MKQHEENALIFAKAIHILHTRREFSARNNTVIISIALFIELGPLRLIRIPKTDKIHEETEIFHDWEIKTASLQKLK